MADPKISWYGHDSFQIVDHGQTLYIDPWKLPPRARPADIILITHEHFDHCSVEDVRAIARPATQIILPEICVEKFPNYQCRVIRPGETLTVNGVQIEAVPAYNIGKDFHPKSDGRVGYVLTIDGQRIYHAGDTDLIPEMDQVRCDIALLPISGMYVMTAEEAATAVEHIKPRIVIPMHYGSVIGSMDDVERFRTLMPDGVELRVLSKTSA